MKKYSSYLDQVTSNVSDMELINNLSEYNEFWYEPLFELLLNTIDPDQVIDDCELPEGTATDSEEYQEAEYEYIYEAIGSAYQLFKVELIGEYNREHERLNIFYDQEVEAYILPVYHFGTAWRIIGPMD